MKKILITGAYGQDGIILSKLLKSKNYKVYGIIKKRDKNKGVKGIFYLKCNLNDFKKINKIIKDIKPNCIVHLGSENPSYKEWN